MQDETLDIKLLGKEYRITCTEEDRGDLLAAAAYLDAKLNEVAAHTKMTGEKISVMAALSITHEFLHYQRSGGFDMLSAKRRIDAMNKRLDGVLAQQEKLF